MRNPPQFIVFALAFGCGTSAPPTPTAAPITVGSVVVTPLGNDIYAAIRTEPLGLAVNSNSLFIVNDDHVVVVDAQFTRAATLENLAALRRITRKPVRYVINTHWHDDHVAGNQVYQDSFPGVRFIAHANTRADLISKGRDNRAGQIKFAPPVADQIERLLGMGLGSDSTPTTPMERASLTSAVKIVRQYLVENAGYREVLPDSLVDRRMVLNGGGRTIEIHWFGRANTRGDVVTYLPREGIVSTGDLVVAPMPFGFGSYPSEWIAVLDSVEARRPRVIIPGHGPIMRDLAYVQQVKRMLTMARDSVRVAAAAGLSVDSTTKIVRLARLQAQLAGDEKWMKWAFGYFFRRPVIGRAYEEAKGTIQ
jgi:cyclase